MLRNFIERSMAERKSYYADERALCLHATFHGSMQEMMKIAEAVYMDYIVSFKPKGLFDCLTDCKRSVRVENLFDEFRKEMEDNLSTDFIVDFYVKTANIKSKKDLKKQENILLNFGSNDRYERKVLKQRLKNVEKYSAQFEEQDREHEKVKKLIHCKEYFPLNYSGGTDATCSFSINQYGTEGEVFKGDLSVRIHLYSLGNHINDTAVCLKNWLEKISNQCTSVTGYVCKGSFYGQFDSPQMGYFDKYINGIVEISGPKSTNRYDCKEWLETNYAEGIEWANVFSNKVADKIDEIDRLKDNDQIECRELRNGGILLYFPKNFDEFESKDVEPIYSYVKRCLRPGSSKYRVKDLVRNMYDLPIFEEDYKVQGSDVLFSRGDFGFVSVPFSIEKNKRECLDDYEEICRTLEMYFQSECIFFPQGSVSVEEIKKSFDEIKQENMIPVILCLDSPIVEHFVDFVSEVPADREVTEQRKFRQNIIDCEEISNKERLEKRFKLKGRIFARGNNRLKGYIDEDENLPMVLMKVREDPVKILEYLQIGECINIGPDILWYSEKWYEAYGAIPAVISDNVIEYSLNRPITKPDAIDVALEHYQLCPDLLYCAGDLEKSILKYAADLTKSTVWYLRFEI